MKHVYVLLLLTVWLLWTPLALTAGDSSEPVGPDALQSRMAELPKQDLSAGERRAVLQLFEFQRLCRNVYETFHSYWRLEDFQDFVHIKQKQLTHLQALLDRYEIDQPLDSESANGYASSKYSKLYENFTKTGRLSLFEALRTAATMEDLIIYTSYDCLHKTDNPDLRLVCRTMTETSRNILQEIKERLTSYGEKLGGNIWMW